MERTNAFVVKWQTRRNGDIFPRWAHQGISMDTKQRSSLKNSFIQCPYKQVHRKSVVDHRESSLLTWFFFPVKAVTLDSTQNQFSNDARARALSKSSWKFESSFFQISKTLSFGSKKRDEKTNKTYFNLMYEKFKRYSFIKETHSSEQCFLEGLRFIFGLARKMLKSEYFTV